MAHIFVWLSFFFLLPIIIYIKPHIVRLGQFVMLLHFSQENEKKRFGWDRIRSCGSLQTHREVFLPSRVSCPQGRPHLSNLCQIHWGDGEYDGQRRSPATKEWWVMSEGRSHAHAAPGSTGTSNSLCVSGKMCLAYHLKRSPFTLCSPKVESKKNSLHLRTLAF